MFDYLHTKYDDSGLSLTDVSNFVVKVYHLCRVSNYSNSRVHGHGQLVVLLKLHPMLTQTWCVWGGERWNTRVKSDDLT